MPGRQIKKTVKRGVTREMAAGDIEFRESRDWLRAIFDGTYEFMGLLDPQGTLLEANRSSLEFIGKAREDVIGRPFWETPWFAFTPGAPKAVREGVARAAAGEFVRFEATVHRSTGEVFVFDISLHPVRNERGEVSLIVPEGRNITEWRAQMAREMRDRERHLTILAKSIPQMLWTATPDGLLNYLSEQGLRYLALEEEKIYGEKWLDAVHPDDRDTAVKTWMKAVETATPYETSYRLRRFDGAMRWQLVRGVPVVDENGAVTQWYGTCTDIEDQKQAEERAGQDRKRWQQLLLRAPAAIALFRGPDHRIEWVNSGLVRLVGRKSESQLIGLTVRDALPELASQGYLEMLDAVFAEGQPYAADEALVLLGEGGGVHEVYVNFVCMPTVDANGNTDGNFVHATDVTDLVQARKRIEESERQFRTLAETIPHLAWMAHADGYIFWYNQRWYDYTGMTFQDMERSGWEQVHDPDVLPKVKERWKLSLESGSPFDMMFPLKGADGLFRTFLTRVEPVKDSAGRVVRWFGTNTDVTEQKQTEEELRLANRDLEEFTFVASHDLQEPLRMVNIYTQLIIKALGDSDEKISRYANVVRQNVGRMETLIQDLLKFSHTVHADDKPSTLRADLAAAFKDAMTVLKSRLEETGAEIHAPQEWPAVYGDTDQLSHVFQNLLANALKYRKTTIRPEISIAVTSDASHCTVSVKDNGIGFEQQHAESIFGLFKRLHRKDAYAGTGLGLAICKRIVERSGGQIWAEGQPGEGATFHFTLLRADEGTS